MAFAYVIVTPVRWNANRADLVYRLALGFEIRAQHLQTALEQSGYSRLRAIHVRGDVTKRDR